MLAGNRIDAWTWKAVQCREVQNRIADEIRCLVQTRLEGPIWNQTDIEVRIQVWSQAEFGAGFSGGDFRNVHG